MAVVKLHCWDFPHIVRTIPTRLWDFDAENSPNISVKSKSAIYSVTVLSMKTSLSHHLSILNPIYVDKVHINVFTTDIENILADTKYTVTTSLLW